MGFQPYIRRIRYGGYTAEDDLLMLFESSCIKQLVSFVCRNNPPLLYTCRVFSVCRVYMSTVYQPYISRLSAVY